MQRQVWDRILEESFLQTESFRYFETLQFSSKIASTQD